MPNNPHPTAIIQSLDADTLKLSIEGAEIAIKHQLAELRALLEAKHIHNVQYADKIYNIAHIGEANFGVVTSKRVFNAVLVKDLLGLIAEREKDPLKAGDAIAAFGGFFLPQRHKGTKRATFQRFALHFHCFHLQLSHWTWMIKNYQTKKNTLVEQLSMLPIWSILVLGQGYWKKFMKPASLMN